MSRYAALIVRLREAPPNVLLQREAADALESLERQVQQLHKDAIEEQREFQREAREIAAEARYAERMGDDYRGCY